jgi:dynein heavy chain 1, cytosolic
VKAYIAAQPLLTDLKSEALKDRHWRTVLRTLNLNSVPLPELTLGHLWSAGLADRRSELSEVITSAQGEMALEEFLRQVRDAWTACALELVPYQGRTRLVKGWDALFAQLEEHLAGLSAMKRSPYFRGVAEFQEDAAAWEERLGKLQAVLDAWVDVQRRWVYLEGIFYGSADIKAQVRC